MSQTSQHDNEPQFTPEEIAYFKAMGNITLFIHGFNIAEGQYANAIETVKRDEVPSLADVDANAGVPNDLDVSWSANQHKVFDSRDLVAERFECSEKALPLDLDDEKLNGSGVHNWFIHMENNLNLATNQFNYTDWTKYSRIVGIGWPGDVGVLNYIESETKADYSALNLYKLIIELHQAGVEINIVAHSMGCRVALSCLNQLGFNHCQNYVKHVFLWQAAVPNTALSTDRTLDQTRRKNGAFIYATQAVECITVLYSRNDPILAMPYWLATYVDKTPSQLWQDLWRSQRSELPAMHDNVILKQLLQLADDNDFKALVAGYLDEGIEGWLGITGDIRQHLAQQLRDINLKLVKRYGLHTALGHDGPYLEDHFIQQQIKDGKIILADMTPWGFGHSYMKIPSADVMRHGYQQWIMNQKYGMKHFGCYDPSKFPNYQPEKQEKVR